MKKLAGLAVLMLLVGATPALAEIKVSGDAYVGVFDKYLWRGIDFSGSTPVAQGGVDLSAHNLTLSYWTNVQLKTDEGLEGGDANETDITLDYAIPVGEKLTINVGNIYYTVDGGNDTNELYLSGTLDTLLEPKLTVYYDWDENKDSRFYTLEIGHSFGLGKMTLSAGALASYMDGTDSMKLVEANVPWNAELSLSADIAVTEQFSITPSFVYSEPLSDDARLVTDSEMAAGLTISHSF